MSVVTFDTLKLAKRLRESGFSDRQAAGATEGIAEALSESYSTKVATIAAIQDVAISINLRIDAAEERLGERITNLEHRVGNLENRVENVEHGVARLEQGQAKLEQGQARLEQGQADHGTRLASLERGQTILNDNQLQTNRALDAIMAHLKIPKP